MRVDFYFDPVCPWTWITSRWVAEVAPYRDLDVTWRTFSLRHHNRDNPGYDWLRERMDQQYPALRVIEAARQAYGEAAVGRLYRALGTLIHHDGDKPLRRLAEGVAAAGLPPHLLDAGADEAWDKAVVASTEAGVALVGADAGIPIVAIEGSRTTLFGPVLSPAPTGAEALALWDCFAALTGFDGLYEIKRTRDVEPALGARP